MKGNNACIVYALALITLLFSCKKADINKESLQLPLTLNEKAKAWFETQQDALKYQQLQLENNVINIQERIDWEKSQYFAEAKALITPVSITSIDGNTSSFKYLMTNVDDEGNVSIGNYYIVLYNKKKLDLTETPIITPELIKLQNVPVFFTGAIIKYDLANKILSSKHYDLGILSDKNDALIVRKSKTQITINNLAPLDEGCSYITINWYWQTWVNGVLVSEEYVFSTNEITCTPGGGGGGTGTLTCEQLNGNFVNQGDALSGPLTTTDEFNDGTNWIKNYNWKIFNASTWGLLSYEKGTLAKIHYSNGDRWEFQSFVHLQIAEAGIAIGGTRTFSDLGATINISSTGMSVWEQIDFSVSSKVTCFTNPVTIPYNANKTFHAPNIIIPVEE